MMSKSVVNFEEGFLKSEESKEPLRMRHIKGDVCQVSSMQIFDDVV